jgi:hypothetical protein
MKRSIFSLAILTLVAAACSQSPEPRSAEVTFKALRAAEHLSDPRKVAKWMIPFSQHQPGELVFTPNSIVAGEDTLVVLQQTAVDVIFTRKSPGQSAAFTITAAPLENRPGITRFLLTYRGPNGAPWTGNSALAESVNASLDSLVTYFSNPLKMYGYPIREIKVTDTAFLFASRTIASADFPQESKALFDMLLRQAGNHKVPYTGVRIFNMDKMGDRRVIYAGIGIEYRVDTQPGDSAEFKWMPYKKNLLAIDLEGPYQDVDKAKEALELYRVDKEMVSMAIPFHKYLSDWYGYTDSQQVRVRVCLPVY